MEHDPHQIKEPLHFKNPPIVEAVIALFVKPLPDDVLQVFKTCTPEMESAGYGNPEPLTQHQFQFRVASGISQSDSQDKQFGIKFRSADNLHATQFTKNAFVFSRLGQYDCWEQFRSEAKKCWDIYARTANITEAISVGVRYVNKLFIPVGVDPEEYVRAVPKFPDSISPSISEIFMRVGMPITKPEGKFIHTQILLPPEREGYATLLFDNDFQFPAREKSTAEVWDLIESVRNIKDRYFVELTTEKMRRTFDA